MRRFAKQKPTDWVCPAGTFQGLSGAWNNEVTVTSTGAEWEICGSTQGGQTADPVTISRYTTLRVVGDIVVSSLYQSVVNNEIQLGCGIYHANTSAATKNPFTDGAYDDWLWLYHVGNWMTSNASGQVMDQPGRIPVDIRVKRVIKSGFGLYLAAFTRAANQAYTITPYLRVLVTRAA